MTVLPKQSSNENTQLQFYSLTLVLLYIDFIQFDLPESISIELTVRNYTSDQFKL